MQPTDYTKSQTKQNQKEERRVCGYMSDDLTKFWLKMGLGIREDCFMKLLRNASENISLPAKNPQEQAFISYAQNFEDVMLWRCLKGVKKGFYVDVGAAWPTLASVTKAFYDRDWSGINIEPDPLVYEQLAKERPRDINLNLALGETSGTAEYYLLADSGLSTLRKDFSSKNSEKTYTKVTTLNCLWEKYLKARDVHFLKIDVEGFERQVIFGNNWALFRPWVVVVEATLPWSTICNKNEWEGLLLEAGYMFAYWDGLNRFYVPEERAELLEAFSAPPNVFDGFVLANLATGQETLESAAISAAEARVIAAENQLKRVYASRSWRLTRFFRTLSQFASHLKQKISGLKTRGSTFR